MIPSRWLLTTISALTAACPVVCGAAFATDAAPVLTGLPAVSVVSGSVGLQVGNLVQDRSFGGFVTIVAPLGSSFGVQVDGGLGSAQGSSYDASGAHLFWRDPSVGLLGGYASYLRWNALDTYPADEPLRGVFDIRGARVGKAGVQGEVYIDRLTLKGLGAYQFGSFNGFAAKGVLAYYVLDNLRVDFMVNRVKGSGRNGSLGVEWAPTDRAPLTLFARAGLNQDRDIRVLGGLQVYFASANKSLIRRHREDLVASDLPDNLFQTIGAGYCPGGTALRNGFCDGNV